MWFIHNRCLGDGQETEFALIDAVPGASASSAWHAEFKMRRALLAY